MQRRTLFVVVTGCMLVAAVAIAQSRSGFPSEVNPSELTTTLRLADLYVARFSRAFEGAIATEHYIQDLSTGGPAPMRPDSSGRVRHEETYATMLFLYPRDERLWLNVRIVERVQYGADQWQS